MSKEIEDRNENNFDETEDELNEEDLELDEDME